MIQFKNLQSLLKNESLTKPQSIQLRAGQILHGQVLKFFQDNIALVQLGGLKLHAKLNAPLVTDVKYWFQVTNNDAMLELKLIDDPELAKLVSLENREGTSKSAVTQLLKQVGLANTKENGQLLAMLVKEGLPFTSEVLKGASDWLKDKPDIDISRGLATIKVAIQRDLPITSNILNSIYAIQTKEPLSANLVSILQDISTMNEKSPTLQQLQTLLKQISTQADNDDLAKTFLQLVKMAVETNNSIDRAIAQSILNKLGIQGNEITDLQSQFQALSNGKKDIANLIVKLFENKNITTEQLMLLKSKLTPIENELINKIQLQSNNTPINWETGKDVLRSFRQIMNSLGVQFEHAIGSALSAPQLDTNLHTLKPLLMQALVEEALTPDQKKKIEQLLNRITGQQLISSTEQGPIQQLIMQMPIQLGNQLTDLTMQWNGRKKKNGEIDPDYCRIIFYLELSQLKETLVDVNVQNRIINIHIINETPELELMVKSFQPILKVQLDQLDYHLSGIKVTDKKKFTKLDNPGHKIQSLQTNHAGMNGVDFLV